ncbi:hypothetical protein HBI56_160810 [Parastagonospora nodorum]|nr:hypothetical protein HBH53_161980 [Parastagonospora nodorum]KAH3994461.1 hypothetical protein HBI10_185560 [Parastagonospora nodorum]KAH4014375.1 hypothetical protein HBI13_173450 [Parastagonospora nodorum]KAH4287301.1 hypothetical protein HBI02_217530 [Parastagonospora nodorum]KAH4292107.1 hypothetical protein HBI01_182910 [Parastagonospora nodorum]
MSTMPVIKKEGSPEPPIASIASAVSSSELSKRAPMSAPRHIPSKERDASMLQPQRTMLPPPRPARKPSLVARTPHLARSAYTGSSPHKFALQVLGNNSSRLNVPPPVFSSLSSRRGLAIATGRVNKTTASTTATCNKTPNLPKITHLTKHIKPKKYTTKTKAKRDTMDQRDFANGGDYFGGDEFLDFPPMMLQEHDDVVTVPREQLEELQYSVQTLHHANATNEQKLQEQGHLIVELVDFNRRTHIALEEIHERMRSLGPATPLQMHQEPSSALGTPFQPMSAYHASNDDRSRSPSPDRSNYRARDEPGKVRKGKGRKVLEIQIPGKMYAGSAIGLPTPLTQSAGFMDRSPVTPLTPGRTGPPSGSKKPNTCINKRGIHNLDKMVAPMYAQLPLLPLTDTEIIVYFFNSLRRPIVALRLYARGWGPAAISDTVNEYRMVEPAYLRNTCSVKCTTAIKKGHEKYGAEWEAETRAIFASQATLDDKATDMIRLDSSEQELAVDFELRALCSGLRKHPGKDQGGIFTRCVQWCEEYDADYKLSNVWELADDLNAGRVPSRFASVAEDESISRAATEDTDDFVIGKDTDASSQE